MLVHHTPQALLSLCPVQHGAVYSRDQTDKKLSKLTAGCQGSRSQPSERDWKGSETLTKDNYESRFTDAVQVH